jgi:hypothetical protein
MRVIAVYLTDADPNQPPVAAYPAPISEETRAQIADFLRRVYPGRSYELREEEVSLSPAPKPH